jgi:DNA polymerase-3 subunit alpha
MFMNVEMLIDTARHVQQDRATGQGSLFETFDENGAAETAAIEMPFVRDWHDNEKLYHEKEVLGLYISGHPLAKYESEIRSFSCVAIRELNEREHADSVAIVGVIYNLKVRMSKAGKKFAVGMIEDMEGTIEAIFVPNTFSQYEKLITMDEPIMLRGKAEFEDEVAKRIIINEVKSLKEIRRDSISAIHIKLDLVGMDEATLKTIKSIIEQNSGGCPVLFHVAGGGGEGKTVRAHRTYNVTPSDGLIRELSQVVGHDSIRYSLKGCQ